MAVAPRNVWPVAIAGGGIGGLACALALARQGFQSLVLEQAREFGEAGVGLQMAPNALSVLDALGVGAAAKKNALMIERLLMMDGVTGQEVANIPCDARFERRFGTFSRTIGLPQGVSEDEIKASYTNGVLEIAVPLPEQTKPKRIEVAVAGEQPTIEGTTS